MCAVSRRRYDGCCQWKAGLTVNRLGLRSNLGHQQIEPTRSYEHVLCQGKRLSFREPQYEQGPLLF